MRWILITILFIVLNCNSEFHGIIDGMNLGNIFQTDLYELKEVEIQNSKLDEIEKWIGSQNEKISSIKAYHATLDEGDSEKTVRILILDLKDIDIENSKLAILIRNTGRVENVRIWGSSHKIQDFDASIENFYRQFDRKTFLLDTNDIVRLSKIDKYADELSDKEKFLYDHKRMMINKNYLIRHTMASTSQDKIPPKKWFMEQQSEFEMLRHSITILNNEIGDEAIQSYQSEAIKAEKDLSNIIKAIDEGESSSGVRSLIKDYRSDNCSSCHNIKSSKLNGTLKKLENEKFTMGFRKDLFRPDLDLWSIPSKPGLTLKLSNAVKKLVLYASITKG